MVIPQLERIYSSTGDGTYPLGIKLQLIPIINKVSNPRAGSEVEMVQNRKAGFDKHLVHIVNLEIGNLD